MVDALTTMRGNEGGWLRGVLSVVQVRMDRGVGLKFCNLDEVMMLAINMLKPSLMSEQRVRQSESEENDECKNGVVMKIDELKAQLHETEDIVETLEKS
ncbi:hypothetical protein Tco_0268439 [Tanacetum coccineum]